MNGPFRVAQVTTTTTDKLRILKIEKPQGGQAVTAEASYDGTVKVDFTAIANEKITLVHIGERLIILFDNQSTVTIIPFFDSMGVPLANIAIESNGKEFTGAEFASTFPITTDQSVLPAAGDGAGTPASGANFSNASVDPLLSPDPLPLLPPEVLPPIEFTRIEAATPTGDLLPSTGPNDPVSIDEDDISSSFSQGNNDDAPGDDDPISITGTLNFTPGDPPTTVDFAEMDGDPVTGVDSVGNPVALQSQGHDLVYIWNGAIGTLFAVWADDLNHVVFEITVNPANGDYTLSLFDQLDHPHSDNPADPSDDTTALGFEDNLTVELIYTVTDADGQTATGSLSVNFDDDMPRIIGEVESRIVDEDDIKTAWSQGTSPNDGDVDGSITENATGAAFVSGTLGGLVSLGADEYPQQGEGEGEGQGVSGPVFGFTDDVVAQMEALDLYSKQSVQPATENGLPLTYTTFQDGDWVVLAAREPDENPGAPDTGNPVFELRVNQFTGEYEFRLFDELIHQLPPGFPNGADENFTLRSTGVDALDFGSIITVTDYDGDAITLAGAFKIQIRDDVPEADIDSNHLGVVQHDETPGTQGPSFFDPFDSDTNSSSVKALFATLETSGNVGNDPNVPGDTNGGVAGDGAIGYARSVLPVVLSVFGTDIGADSPAASSTFAIQIVGGNGTDSGLTLTDGSHIHLFQEGNLIVGRVVDQLGVVNYVDQAAFAIHIDNGGFVSLAQYLSLQHPDFPDNHDESINLDGLIDAVLTVTDSDGDSNSDSVEIGSQIRFDDDGPDVDVRDQVSEAERAQLRLALDESVQPDGGDSDTYDRYNSPETESGGGPSNGGSDDVDPGAADQNYNQIPVVDIGANLVADEAIGSRTTNVTGGLNALFNVTVDFGADGPLPGDGPNPTDGLGFNLTGGGETNLVVTALDGTALEGLSVANRTVFLVQVDDNTIEGRIKGADGLLNDGSDDFVAFRIAITPDSQIKLDQFLAIDHDASEPSGSAENPENPSLYDESIELRMVGSNNTFQLVRTVTATDGDNDQDTDSDTVTLAGTGSSFFTFDDDGPKMDGKICLTPGGAEGADPSDLLYVLPPGAGLTVSVTDIIEDAGFENALGYYFADAAGNPISGVILSDHIGNPVNQDLLFTVPPDSIPAGAVMLGLFIVPDGNTINGTLADGDPITFNLVSGVWVASNPNGPLDSAQDRILFSDRRLNPDDNDSGTSPNDFEVPGGIRESNWEDKINGDNDFNDVRFNIQVCATPNIIIVVDEDGLAGHAVDGNPVPRPGEVDGPELTVVSGAAGALTALVLFGTDGPHPTQPISLAVVATPTPTGLTSQGGAVLVVSDGSTLTGYVEQADGAGFQPGDRAVFTLTVTPAGGYTFTLLDHVDHPPLNGEPDDNSETLLGTPLDLSAFIIATDGDGDRITLASESFIIQILDDIPVANLIPYENQSIVLDETDSALDGDGDGDDGVAGGILSQKTVLGSALFTDASQPGADAPASKVYSLVLNAGPTGLTDTLSGDPIVLTQPIAGGTIEAHAGSSVGPLVFTIAINGTGDVTVTQSRAIKHNDFPADHDEADDPESLAAGLVQLAVTVTDADQDSVSDSIELGSLIKFEDDGPDVDIVDAPDTVNEGDTIDGTWTLAAGSDGVSSVDVTVGGVTKTLSLAAPGNTVTFGAGDGLTVGTLTVDADLQWHFTANEVDEDEQVTFSVKATDGDGDVDTDSHTITVTDGFEEPSFRAESFAAFAPSIDLDPGSDDAIATAWNHPAPEATVYDGGDGIDTIRVVFTPDQLNEILNSVGQRDALRTFLAAPGSNDLDLDASSWNAKVVDFEAANLGISALPETSLDTWNPIPAAVAVGAGTDGANLIVGSAAGQTLDGLGGNDVLAAFHTGANTLNGGAGSDLLLGGDGDDILNGGDGTDILAGGKGADTFKASSTPGDANEDTIVDYAFAEGDSLDLSALLDAAFDAGDNINSFIQVTTVNTNDLLVRVDQTGAGTFGSEQDVFLLTGAATNGGDPLRAFFDGTNQVVTG